MSKKGAIEGERTVCEERRDRRQAVKMKSYPVDLLHLGAVRQKVVSNGTAFLGQSAEAEPAYVASVSILVQLFMLGCTFVIGHILRRNKIMVVHEAGAALLLGVVVGMIVKISGEESGFRDWINFNNSFFFYFLLPPIIFDSGWSLKTRPFFGNFGAICVFAFLGTLISTFAVGIFIWIFGSLHLTYSMPFMVCLTFGALISATDPVTVLALFNELGVDPNLYAYVFGESVLNDAVAIVMYRTVLGFVGSEISRGGIIGAFSYFIANFIGSFSIGVMCSMGSALLFKYGGLNDHGLGVLESCLVVLFPYASYMMADALELSGIVAILFAGITMKYYTAPLMSSAAQNITTSFFQMLAKLSETFVLLRLHRALIMKQASCTLPPNHQLAPSVFIYMGVAMFLEQQSWNNLGFTFFTIISIMIGRALNVYPCTIIVNRFREKPSHIPVNQQHALWFSGLRGAMAFALALQSVTDLPNNHGRVLLTSTLFTIFFTVLLIGGSTPFILHHLKIECHGSSGNGESDPSMLGLHEVHLNLVEANIPTTPHGGLETPEDLEEEEDVAGLGILERQKAKLQKKLKKLKNDTTFARLDKKYIKPFFASPTSGESSVSGPASPVHAGHDADSGMTTFKTLPSRTSDRRSLIVDAFYARNDNSPSGSRKSLRMASGGAQMTDIWSQPPAWPTAGISRVSNSQRLDTWAVSEAMESSPTEAQQQQGEIWSLTPLTSPEKAMPSKSQMEESAWPSSGSWPSRGKQLNTWSHAGQASGSQLRDDSKWPKSNDWNVPVRPKSPEWGAPTSLDASQPASVLFSKQESTDADYSTIDLT